MGKLQKDSLWAVASENYWCKMIINYSFSTSYLTGSILPTILQCIYQLNSGSQSFDFLISLFCIESNCFCNYGNKTIFKSDLTSHSFRHLRSFLLFSVQVFPLLLGEEEMGLSGKCGQQEASEKNLNQAGSVLAMVITTETHN